jgi:predicted HTH transcriptional regulator
MEEEQKESETPKEESLSEKKPSTEASVKTPQVPPETQPEETTPDVLKENEQVPAKTSAQAPLETQPEVKEPQVETQGIAQQVPQTEKIAQPEIQVPPEVSKLRQLWQKALEKIRERKSKRLEKILQFAKEKREITNDDVEKLLHVSDITATRYLNELVKQGRLKRIGPPSRAKYKLY